MLIEQNDEPVSIVPTLLALGACALIALIMVVDVLGMIAEGSPL